jgi:hypothetical protein
MLIISMYFTPLLGCSQVVRRMFLVRAFVGSSPTTPEYVGRGPRGAGCWVLLGAAGPAAG